MIGFYCMDGDRKSKIIFRDVQQYYTSFSLFVRIFLIAYKKFIIRSTIDSIENVLTNL